MLIERLEMRNFRGHIDTAMDFGAGLTAILGENGAGKSTALEAMLWALYGTKAARGKKEDLAFWGAEKGQKTEVVFMFRLDGVSYRFARSTKEATAFRGGTADAEGLDGVTGYAEKLLGMGREEFTATYFTGQKDLEWLKGKGAADRARFLGKVLGYDRLKLAQQIVRERKNRQKSTVEGLDVALASIGEVDPAQIREARDRATDAADAVLEHRARKEDLDQRKSANLQSVSALNLKRKSWMAARDGVRSAEQVLKSATEAMDRIRSDLQATDGAELEVEALESDVRVLEEKARIREEALRRAREARIQADGQFQAAERALKDAERELRKLRETGPGGKCYACGQDLGEAFHDSLRTQEERVDGLVRERDRLEAIYRSERENESRAAAEPDPAPRLKALASDLHRARHRAESREELKRREQAEGPKIEAARHALEAARGDLAASAYDESEFDRLTMEGQQLDEALRKVDGRLQDAMLAEQREAARAEQLSKDLEKRRETEARRKDALRSLAIEEDADRAYTELRTALNAQMRPELSEIATQIISEITDGWFTEFILDEDYKIRLFALGREVPVISGGEEDVANLALRIAVSALVSERSGRPLSMLVLDEVFGSLNAARQEAVIEALRRLAGERFEQVIIITHTERAREMADSVIEVVRDEATGASRVVNGYGTMGEGVE